MSGLEILLKPFDAKYISKKPKPTRAQTEAVKNNRNLGLWCKQCGTYHHKDAAHLDYVGHAAITAKLLDADQKWSWEPLAFDDSGLPLFDRSGGLWIRLTVCGVSRIGYGNAVVGPTSEAGDREKQVISDALRNAAMRFGAALDLWHKGETSLFDEVVDVQSDAEDSRPALEYYPQDKFEANFPAWEKAILSGKYTTADMIAVVSTKGTLTAEQAAAINNVGVAQ